MHIDSPIIKSMLDDDLYKFTTGAVVFKWFPLVRVSYKFINRGKTPFPEGFDRELIKQIHMLKEIRLTQDEFIWLRENVGMLGDEYLRFLYRYQYDPHEVSLKQTGGELEVFITGYWHKTILWEVKLLAIISELYFLMTGQKPDSMWQRRILEKGQRMSIHGCEFMEFGTRRRFSYHTQDAVVSELQPFHGFLGSSNPHLAMRHKVPVKGTYPHEAIMAMSACYGLKDANTVWMAFWENYYNGALTIALPDTFTTDFFLREVPPSMLAKWNGLRQDSGNPLEWAYDKVLPYYLRHGIDARKKQLIFSNELTDYKLVDYTKALRQHCRPQGGIGTYLTNDVGVKPLNIVIKMHQACFSNHKWENVVKLSDDKGKYTGSAIDIATALATIERTTSVPA